jgi:hypothetical protein
MIVNVQIALDKIGLKKIYRTLYQGTILYKGVVHSKINEKLLKPCWFAFEKSVAQAYATKYAQETNAKVLVISTIVKVDLNLLNVCSKSFKTDFVEKCNQIYDFYDETKYKAFLALGIVSFENQKKHFEELFENHECDSQIIEVGNAFGGHRLSTPDTDTAMVRAMINCYKDCQGYIQPGYLPTCFNGGNNLSDGFPSEVCIFNCAEYLTEPTIIDDKPKGGADYNNNPVERVPISPMDRDEYIVAHWDEYKMPQPRKEFIVENINEPSIKKVGGNNKCKCDKTPKKSKPIANRKKK